VVGLTGGKGRRGGYKPPKWQDDLVKRYDQIRVSENDPVYSYDCLSCGGRCCAGVDVIIGPQDIYRIVAGGTGAKLGLEYSHRFFEPEPRSGQSLMEYYLGPSSNLPMACIKRRKLKDRLDLCPFLAPAYVVSSPEDLEKARTGRASELPMLKSRDGSSSGLCVLEQAKPTVCRAYPLGRVGKAKLEQGHPKLEYVWVESEECRRFRVPESQTTVKEYVAKWGLEESYRQSDRVNEWREEVNKVQDQRMRFLLGLLFFDFDIFPLEYLKSTAVPEEKRLEIVKAVRPKSFDALADRQMKSVREVLEGNYPTLPKPE
jgi:hypothetical protein